MTTPDSAQGRPVPDTEDLRLLAEIINNGSIGLPQAAWNARMSQVEAAARFVTMAERGMPLRLVAEGDRQLLWQIAQAGPATGGVPLAGAAPGPDPLPAADAPAAPAPAEAAPQPPPQPAATEQDRSGGPIPTGAPTGSESTWAHPQSEPAADPPVPVESHPVQQIPLPPLTPPPVPAVALPPASPVPPHEQAIAGAVPLGQPPFGAGNTDGEQPAETAGTADEASAPPPAEAVPADAAPADAAPAEAVPAGSSTWGLPGTSAWVRTDDPEMTQTEPPPNQDDDRPEESRAEPTAPPATAEPSSPTSRVMISGQPTQSIVGLFGEHLDVSLLGIIDPADAILTSVGYRLEAGERALLVQTSIGNRGPIDYESLPDLYLVLVGSTGDILPKAAMAVGGYPAHRVGVAANSLVSGWTVFLVPAATEVTELRWSVRPDLANRTVTWGFGPA